MGDPTFQARSRSGSTWGGVVQGAVSRCAQRQFDAGALEVEIIGDQGRSVLRPGARFQEVDAHPVSVKDAPDSARVPGAGRRRMVMRIAFWMIALLAIGITAGAVVTINLAKRAVTDQAMGKLKSAMREGIVEATLSDVDLEDGLVYRFQVLLDGKPAMKASFEVLGGSVRLGR